jgi:hypothetical protein
MITSFILGPASRRLPELWNHRRKRMLFRFLSPCSAVVFWATGALSAQSGSSTLSNDDCLTCHADKTAARADGTSVYVDKDLYAKSIHGQTGQDCIVCHVDLEKMKEPPHADKLQPAQCSSCHEKEQRKYAEGIHAQQRTSGNKMAANCVDCHGMHDILPKTDADSRVHPMHLPDTCGKCHTRTTIRPDPTGINGNHRQNVYELYTESIHGKVLKNSGLTITAICSTCHGAHDIRLGNDPKSTVARRNVPTLCGQCHGGIYAQFLKSVHGKAYKDGIQDVPVCTDCHSEHSIKAATESDSSVSAKLVGATCSRCHENQALAKTYGLAGKRLSTYSESYHGIAMAFNQTTVANCASCHGFHSILPSSDPASSINKAQLVKTCGKCHLGAGDNFALVKMHQANAKEDNFWAYTLRQFYIWLIVVIIGGFLLFISADLYGRARGRHA